MTMPTRVDVLNEAVARLWEAVCELVVTVLDDPSDDADLASLDVLREQVSELQADAHAARRALELGAIGLADLHDAIDAAASRYWRELCGFRAVYELRLAASQRATWRNWATGVEHALARCAPPLDETRAAIRAAWRAGPHHDPFIPAPAPQNDPGGHHVPR